MTRKEWAATLGSSAAGFQIGLDLWWMTDMDIFGVIFLTAMATVFIFLWCWGKATEKKKKRVRHMPKIPYDLSKTEWPYMYELDEHGNKRRLVCER